MPTQLQDKLPEPAVVPHDFREQPSSVREHWPSVCHFTVAHTELKSRTFHRELLPLAELGWRVRYISPMPKEGLHQGIRLVRLKSKGGRLRHLIASHDLLRQLLAQDASIYHFQDPELLPLSIVLKVF